MGLGWVEDFQEEGNYGGKTEGGKVLSKSKTKKTKKCGSVPEAIRRSSLEAA